MARVWQIAAGEPQRNYTQLFLDHDVVFLGPGRYGDYTRKRDDYAKLVANGDWASSRIGQIRSFAEEMQPGDVVLLRYGYRVESIGLAAEQGYAWNETFDDVFGWDLQHTRRVIWQDDLQGELRQLQPGAAQGLFSKRRQIPTFTAVRDPIVLAPLEGLVDRCRSRPLRPLPSPPSDPLSLDELGRELFARGVPNESVDAVLVAIQHQRRLSDWYRTHGARSGRPTEHEVVAHMVVPLLLSLGWSEQLLAVEWHKIDLAAFRGTPTIPAGCLLVCEAKGIGHGLAAAFAQARAYVKHLKLDACQKILLTDGARLYLYQRAEGEWEEAPAGYLNVDRIRTSHLDPVGTNAVDTIVALTPAGAARPLSRSVVAPLGQ